eukprot:scaffold676_cov316-Pavlova_lutheri.AAC.48
MPLTICGKAARTCCCCLLLNWAYIRKCSSEASCPPAPVAKGWSDTFAQAATLRRRQVVEPPFGVPLRPFPRPSSPFLADLHVSPSPLRRVPFGAIHTHPSHAPTPAWRPHARIRFSLLLAPGFRPSTCFRPHRSFGCARFPFFATRSPPTVHPFPPTRDAHVPRAPRLGSVQVFREEGWVPAGHFAPRAAEDGAGTKGMPLRGRGAGREEGEGIPGVNP